MARRFVQTLVSLVLRVTVLPVVLGVMLAPFVLGCLVTVALSLTVAPPRLVLLAGPVLGLAVTALWWLPRWRRATPPAWLDRATALALGRR
ncbi:hypothetical protein [Pararhodospirillum photometricum]|uniref:Uncharacterized protein n=1 Tax=Pararhodospirillum photometricum DSM 122 TaxID=1150469 RepID=H6SJG9_PARPM|nr:hypothetical protein [Pararhodospirillum photometricum]CCG08134.1 unnamed protein product [Pararhodospirillum photometricum DSM 122]